MQVYNKGQIIFVRLYPNEDIISSLIKTCEQYDLPSAILLSGIGQIKRVTLGYFKEKNNYTPETFNGPFELLSLNGTLIQHNSTYKAHLHVVISDEDKQVRGGHLIGGSVEVTNEIVLLSIKASLQRQYNKETGLFDLILPNDI